MQGPHVSLHLVYFLSKRFEQFLLSFVIVEFNVIDQQPNFVRSRTWNMHFAPIALHLDYISSRWRVIKRDFVHLEIRIHKTEQK